MTTILAIPNVADEKIREEIAKRLEGDFSYGIIGSNFKNTALFIRVHAKQQRR